VHAAGVIVDPTGVIATAYHVVDKPDAVARCVMTADGRYYPIEAILAANRPGDAALIRIAADGLSSAPLSTGDVEGSALTIVSHPAGEFYSVTAGHLRRFQAAVVLGREVVQMAITADFADGASGGPVFNDRGEVAGIVSFRRPAGSNQTAHIVVPAKALWELLESAR
jgi:S1-C subfamily serine protease